MNEDSLLELLNSKLQVDLKSTKADPYCYHDAYNENYTVELKCRRKHYSTQLIEKHKIDKNCGDGKSFLYVVSTPSGIFGFDVSALIADNYEFNWETKKLPATTDFGRTQWVDKVVGYIDVADAFLREKL